MLTNQTTRYTMVLDNASSYIELPRKLENIKYVRISNLKYKAIGVSQELLMMQMRTQSGIHMNHNLYFSGDAFINVTKSFYLGPQNSTTLFEAQSNEQWTVQLDRPEQITTLQIEFLIDGAIASDISPANQVVITIDFIGA